MSTSESNKVVLFFIGDSDIARWPSDLIPSIPNLEIMKHHNFEQVIFNHSQSGALLQNVPSQIKKVLDEFNQQLTCGGGDHHSRIFFICCAGENDVSNGHSIDTIMASFQKVLDSIFSGCICETRPRLIFLGPKLEPWLEDDMEARKSYFHLSERLSRSCQTFGTNETLDHNENKDNQSCHPDGKNAISYVNCLTMFCGDSADLPGAVLAGRAKAETKYFNKDMLHLSEEGYKVWKEEIEWIISSIICTERCTHSLDMSHGGKKIVLD